MPPACIDSIDCTVLTVQEPENEGSDVPVAALRKRLVDKLQLHHRLVRPSEQVSSRRGLTHCWFCAVCVLLCVCCEELHKLQLHPRPLSR